MNVILRDEDGLTDEDAIMDTKSMPVSEVDNYISLIQKYGYMDTDGMSFTFNYAQIEPEGICIYLTRSKKDS